MSGKLKKTVSALLRDAEALQTVEPELCCTLFRKGLNISGLTKRLRIADETWIEEFLELGGLDDIFFALNSFSGRSFMDMKDVVTQLMCVQAVGEIMNKEIGLRYMVHENGKKHIKELVLDLDSNYVHLKKLIIDILSALCFYSREGHAIVLEALHSYKNYKGTSSTFGILLQELKKGETVEYRSAVLGFINCLVGAPEDVTHRMRLRNQFTRLGIMDVLSKGEDTEVDIFKMQLYKWESEQHQDEMELAEIRGVDSVNLEDSFSLLLAKANTPTTSASLFGIVDHLISIQENELLKSDSLWEVLESTLASAADIKSKEEANQFVQLYQSTKERSKFELPSNSPHKQESLSSAPRTTPEEDAPRSSSPVYTASSPAPPTTPPPSAPPPPPSAPPPPPLPPCAPLPPPLPPSAPLPPFPFKASSAISGPSSADSHDQDTLIKLHWQKMAAKNDSVFTQIDKSHLKIDLDSAEIQKYFTRKSVKVTKALKTTSNGKKTTFLDQGLSMNSGIFLRQGGLKPEKVASLIESGQLGKLKVTQVKNLQMLVKKAEAMKIGEKFKSFKGDGTDLQEPDQLFFHIFAVPDYSLRLTVACLNNELEERANDIRKNLNIIMSAAREIVSSEKISQIFQLILMIGNILNSGSLHGNASGFKISSLSKVMGTQTAKPGFKLSHLLISKMEEVQPELLHLSSDLPSLKQASRMSLDDVIGQAEALQVTVTEVSTSLAKASQHLKEEATSIVEEAKTVSDQLMDLAGQTKSKCKAAVEYFGEDSKKFKIQELLQEFSTFLESLKKSQQDIIRSKEIEKKAQFLSEQREKLKRKEGKESQPVGAGSELPIFETIVKAIKAGEVPLSRRYTVAKGRGPMLKQWSVQENIQEPSAKRRPLRRSQSLSPDLEDVEVSFDKTKVTEALDEVQEEHSEASGGMNEMSETGKDSPPSYKGNLPHTASSDPTDSEDTSEEPAEPGTSLQPLEPTSSSPCKALFKLGFLFLFFLLSVTLAVIYTQFI